MLINDNTIDVGTARYWCMFSEISLDDILDKAKDKALRKSKEKADQPDKINEVFDFGSALTWFFMGSSLLAMLSPYLKNLWKKISSTRKDAIAEVKFTADDSDYDVKFDIKKMKWVMHSSFSISDYEIQQFFDTDFFKKFNSRCQHYIEPFFKNKQVLLKSLEKIKDNKYKDFMMDLLKNEQRIRLNMFEAKYVT